MGARPGGSHDPPLLPQTALQLEPLHFLQCHSKNNSPRDLETQLWACAFEPAWDEGTSLGGQAGRGPQGTSRASFLGMGPGNTTCRGLPGWTGESGGTESLKRPQGQEEGLQWGTLQRTFSPG